jgi:L-ascorbate metabolism protein UlaG (beta-lactamase superfamily)
VPITADQLASLPQDETVFFRLGHSSVLIWLDGEFWLTDPIFSERASPFSFIGPQRFHPSPISLADLPNIKGVILSHNHYDHMDKATLQTLKDKADNFYMPLGLGGDLKKWGIEDAKINELDWWDNIKIGEVTLTATPSFHFSGRSLSDSNQTLWASWVITGSKHNLFFSGDSGYFDGFKKIGERLGPFDVSFMETGAYNKLWPYVHMQPAASVKAHLDLNAKLMIPIHNGTFDLALHTWFDPFEKIEKLAKKIDFKWYTPSIGEAVSVGNSQPINRWWQDSIVEEVQ